jgi:hypothetical protein
MIITGFGIIYSNYLRQRDTKSWMMSSGILIRYSNYLRQKETKSWIMYSGILIQYLNYLRQRETKSWMMSSGILIDIWITFDKEKRSHEWCLQVLSSIFELPATRRNEIMNDVFSYSHTIFELPSTKRNEVMYDVLRYSHTIFELPSTKRNEVMYDVFRYSCLRGIRIPLFYSTYWINRQQWWKKCLRLLPQNYGSVGSGTAGLKFITDYAKHYGSKL